jgi:hypothetical protein
MPQRKKARSNGGSSSRGNRSRKREEYPDYSVVDREKIPEGPDVLLDVPVVKVDKIDIEVEDLRAQVAVRADVRKLLKLSVGVHAKLDQVELNIEGVEAQALLKARLDNVSGILDRVVTTLDRNPELLESVGRAVEDVGGGAGHMLDESGDAIEDVGEGAGQALPQVGQGANQALGQVGQGANQALGEVGKGAGQGVAGVGQGVQQGVGKLSGQQQGGQQKGRG